MNSFSCGRVAFCRAMICSFGGAEAVCYVRHACEFVLVSWLLIKRTGCSMSWKPHTTMGAEDEELFATEEDEAEVDEAILGGKESKEIKM